MSDLPTGLASLPIPNNWPLPLFRYGQRVTVENEGNGTVTGMDFSNGSVIHEGWSYFVLLDKWLHTGRDWSQIFYEDELAPLSSDAIAQ